MKLLCASVPFHAHRAGLLFWVLACLLPDGLIFASERDVLELHFISVGYADAAFIKTAKHTLLIDAGDDSKNPRLKRFLAEQGVRRMDALIVTHPHENHFAGFTDLVSEIPVRTFYGNGELHPDAGYDELVRSLRERGTIVRTLKAGDRLHFGSLSILVLHPVSPEPRDPNANSLVLKLAWGRSSCIFTGDISLDIQRQLLNHWGKELSGGVVTIPHHGDRMIDELWARFRKSFKVISTGPYHGSHAVISPHEHTSAQSDSRTFRTDRHGNLNFEITPMRIRVKTPSLALRDEASSTGRKRAAARIPEGG
jgi:competence protein ComEC